MLRISRKDPDKKLFKSLVKQARKREFDLSLWMREHYPSDESLVKSLNKTYLATIIAERMTRQLFPESESESVLAPESVEAALSIKSYESLFFVILVYVEKRECSLADAKGAITRLNGALGTKFML